MYSKSQKLLRQRQIADGLGHFRIVRGKLSCSLDPIPVAVGALDCHLLGAETVGSWWVR